MFAELDPYKIQLQLRPTHLSRVVYQWPHAIPVVILDIAPNMTQNRYARVSLFSAFN